MNAPLAHNAYRPPVAEPGLPIGQLAALFLMFAAGGPVLAGTIGPGALSTTVLFCVFAAGGLMLCRRTHSRLNDPGLRVLGYLWLVKLGLTLVLLYAGWIPELDPDSPSWGYDPQRFYFQAQELVDNGWSPDFLSLNYIGVLYYYGAVFAAVGHNPVIPALVNSFVTLLGTLYLITVAYEVKPERTSGDWTLALALLLPEMLWFDVMTSRETLMAALLLPSMLTMGRYLLQTAPISAWRVAAVTAASLVAIAAVRTSMVLPVFVSIALMILLFRGRNRSGGLVLGIAIGALLLLGAPLMATLIGGYVFDMGEILTQSTSASVNVASAAGSEWSENSIGLLLMPEGVLQSLLFLPPRFVLYLASPLPNIAVPLEALTGGSWDAWQRLCVILSSLLNVLAMPYAMASLIQSIRERTKYAPYLVLHIPYWVTMITVAGGNLIIHERYRVMATPLLWACAWLGLQTCPKHLIVRAQAYWYGLLCLSAVFYLAYKAS